MENSRDCPKQVIKSQLTLIESLKQPGYLYMARCPVCNDLCFSDMKYCSECGQKLDFSNNKEGE